MLLKNVAFIEFDFVGVDILPRDVAFCTHKHQINESFSRKGHLYRLDMSGWSTNFASLNPLLVCYCASFSRILLCAWTPVSS